MDFETQIDNTQDFSLKWNKYKGRDILPLWIADSDYKTAPVVIDALQKRVAQGVFGYTQQPTTEVKEAIVYHLKTQHDWDIDADWIVPLNSVVSGLTISCLVSGDEGDAVIVPATIYPPFNKVISYTKRTSIRVPVVLNTNLSSNLDTDLSTNQNTALNKGQDTAAENERWVLDFEALEASITADTKLLLFCNPQNPGGVVYTRAELEQLHAICERHDLLISSDEIHCDLVLDKDKKHIPIASINEDAAKRTITLMAASKTYNIAGLGFGFAIIADTKLRKKFRKHAIEKMPEVNLLAQVATTAAFMHGEPWRLAQIEHLRKNRDYLMQQINSIPGLKMYPLEATFLAWIDVSELLLTDVERFFEDAGVGISAGTYFGDGHFVRINFACSSATLTEAVSRIRKAIAGISIAG